VNGYLLGTGRDTVRGKWWRIELKGSWLKVGESMYERMEVKNRIINIGFSLLDGLGEKC